MGDETDEFIVDAFSRRIVGWRVASNMRTDMVLDALEMARRSRGARRYNVSGRAVVNAEEGLRDLFDELGYNVTGVWRRMANTRALDGTQTAEGEKSSMTWTYHPDSGLNIVIENNR